MFIMVIAIIDFTVLFCTCVMNGNGGNVNIWLSGILHGWAGGFVL